MGRGDDGYTLGFRYMFGLHAILCQSPIDAVLQINFADRRAWSGKAMDRRITISANNLFGGESREGGVSGYIDIEGGLPDQAQNSYLANRLDGLVPNFRGVVGLVFRRFYWGNNPYPKPWRVKLQNVFSTYEGWLPSLAPVNVTVSFRKTAIYIALDDSGSMASGTRLETMKTAVNGLLDEIPLNDKIAIKIVKFGGVIEASTTHYGYTAAARTACKNFVNTFSANTGSTDFADALSEADTFFETADAAIPVTTNGAEPYEGASSGGSQTGESRTDDALYRVVLFVTDGVPFVAGQTAQENVDLALAALDAISPRPEVFAVNIDLENTEFTEQIDTDGFVPVIEDGQEEELNQVLSASFSSFADINAAHILRDVLISPTNDGSGDASQIGDSFAEAAQTLFTEGLGLSLFWNNPSDRDSFKKLIEDHISGVSYFDHSTGKWELKLIRPDYNVGELFTFDSSNIVDWQEPPERAIFQELPNQITLEYTRRKNGESTAVTVTNIAGIQETGRVINEKVSLPGITWPALASKIAERELVARGTPLLKGGFKASYMPADLNIGSPFLINESRLGLNNLVCRILEIEETDGKDNSVLIRFTEDVFSTDMQQAPIADDDTEVIEEDDQDPEALPPNVTAAFELPYYELTKILGEDEINLDLIQDQDLGYWGATCDQPDDDHINAQVARLGSSSGYISVGFTSFASAWVLNETLDSQASSTTFTAPENGTESSVAVGDLAFIENEIVRIDSISVVDGVSTFTVGRGCLDTVPKSHGKGSYLLLFQDLYRSDFIEYTAGESVTVKVLPAIQSAIVDINNVGPQVILMQSRAFRPYPVGNLRIESSYSPSNVLTGVVEATWAHRDRLTQITALVEDHADGNIGPEDGVEYKPVARIMQVRSDFFTSGSNLFDHDDFFIDSTPMAETEYDLSPGDSLSYSFDLDALETYFDDSVAAVDLGVRTYRESPAYENWQTPFVRVKPLLSPVLLEGQSSGEESVSGYTSSPSVAPEPGTEPIDVAAISRFTVTRAVPEQINVAAISRFTVTRAVPEQVYVAAISRFTITRTP